MNKNIQSGSEGLFQDIFNKKTLMSCFVGLVILFALIFIFTLLVNNETISPERMPLLAGIAVFLCGAVSSFLAAGKSRKILTSIVCFAFLMILLGALGSIIFPGAFSLKSFLYVLIILLVSCIIGGVASSLRK